MAETAASVKAGSKGPKKSLTRKRKTKTGKIKKKEKAKDSIEKERAFRRAKAKYAFKRFFRMEYWKKTRIET